MSIYYQPYLPNHFSAGLRVFRVALLALIFVGSSVPILFAQENTEDKVKKAIERLSDPNAEVRREAAKELAEIGPDAKFAVSNLGQALGDADHIVRVTAAAALFRIGSDSIDALPALIKALEDENVEVRRMSVEALGSIGSGAEAAIPHLIRIIEKKEEDSNIRAAGLRALGRIGKNPGRCVPVIIEAMKDENDNLRYNALTALRNFKLHMKEQAQKIADMLKEDDNLLIRTKAAEISWELEEAARPVVPVLIGLIANTKEDLNLRAKSIHTLTKLTRETINPYSDIDSPNDNRINELLANIKSSIPALIKILKNKDEDKDVRKAAIEAIPLVSPYEIPALDLLTECLKDPDERPLAINSIEIIATNLAEADRVDSLTQLNRAAKEIRIYGGEASALQQHIDSLTDAQGTPLWDFIKQNWYFALIFGLPIISLPINVLIFYFRPLWLLRIGAVLKHVRLEKLGGIVSAEYFFTVGFFQYRNRVLNKWVERHIETVQSSFKKKHPIVSSPIPISYDGVTLLNLPVPTLQNLFKKNRVRVLIHEEESVVKTDLALQIAMMGMSEDMRLCKDHRMIPLMVCSEMLNSVKDGKDPFFEAVCNELEVLTDLQNPISGDLVIQLLRRKRVLVLIYGLSMTEISHRISLSLSRPAALVVTSSNAEVLGRNVTIIRPIQPEIV